MKVAILIYPGFTALDATGPFEILNRLPDSDVRFVSPDGGRITADYPSFTIDSEPFGALPNPDVVVVAGGSRTHDQLGRDEIRSWLTSCAESAHRVTSVCTGALLLGDAGLLDGRRATTHWYELDSLRAFGAIPVSERVVCDGNVISCAGVSSGIDMALYLVSQLVDDEYAQCVQLGVEYAPEPPFSSGSVETAPVAVVEHMTQMMKTYYGPNWGDRVAERDSS